MKNLIVHRQRRRDLQFIKDLLANNYQVSKIHCTVNVNNDDLYILFGNQFYIVPINCERNISTLNITKEKYSEFVGLEYCITTQELYCAYETGEIARMDVTNESHFEYEIIVKFDDRLQCMKLSPDHEIITVVTSTGIVITMVDFQVMSEVDLYSSNFGEKQFVTIGWGSKNTQFHGSEGKSAAKAKPEPVNVNELDDGIPRITWRGDGTLFAVSFLHATTKIRQFKIFNRMGILQYTSESSNGLEECLAWKPSGNLIATTQRLVNKHVVALFEKNGLKHKEFLLPFGVKEVTIKDLFWSPNSDILTIICEQSETNNTLLLLWTESNCHGYLKQTITFTTDNPLIYTTWSTTGRYNEKELIILTSQEIMFCSFNWCVNHSRGKTANDKAIVGVVDGNKMLVTGFRVGIVPPPMAHQTLEIQESINAIIFAPDIDKEISWINSNTFFTVSCNNRLTFFREITDSTTLEYESLKSCTIDSDVQNDPSDYTMHHFLWFTKDIILCSKVTDSHNLLCVLFLDEINSTQDGRLTIRKTYAIDSPIEHIISSPDANVAFIIANKLILKYTEDMELEPMDIEINEPCCQVEVIKIGSKHVIIALSYTNCFSINGKEVANNITSYYVHSEFLLLTTLQHTLICVALNENGMKQLNKHDLIIKPWESHTLPDINIRRVERGSYIIAALSKDSKIILQVPRGNIECIQPRALSIHIIGFYLNNCNYLSAFEIMRKQRINLNLIYDHNPELFMNNAEKFVEQIANPSWLSLFLSELQNDDVTNTMYANCYQERSPMCKNNEIQINKIEDVCESLRNIMEKRCDTHNLIQPILISLVKNQQRQGLEAALRKINQLKALEDSHKSIISSKNALKYLLYLVDINILYDIALGMYDFELTMFIASESQKDPKEYIPYLNNLKKLDNNFMKYSIDMDLKRYESALKHVSKEPTKFEECLNLIRNQNLYTKGLKLFNRSSTEYKGIAEAYGEFLLRKKRYQEAAIMFDKSDNFNKALDAYMLAGSWQDVIIESKKIEFSPSDLHAVYEELVDHLKTERKYDDAAEILKHYLNDPEEAIALLCKGRNWKHAARMTHDIQRFDLNETHIRPSIYEHAEYVISHLNRIKEDFLRHKSRLALVRTKISKQVLQHNDDVISSIEIPDGLSDTSSVAGSVLSRKSQMSTSSKRSYRSSKNRRKQERKLLNLKEGSMFEDLALIHTLYHIINNAYKNRDEWYQLVQALIQFQFDEYAEELQIDIKNFFELVEMSKSEIWDKSATTRLAEVTDTMLLTPAQHQEITTSLKLIEPYIKNPPQSDTIPYMLDIF